MNHISRIVDVSWAAKMIQPLADNGEGSPASKLARSFNLAQVTGGEVLRISALGMYRAYVNGQRVGRDALTPGWTNYDVRLSYQTYEIGDLLHPGQNTIEILLGDGWFRSPLMWIEERRDNVWGTRTAAIAEIRSVPGGEVLLATDDRWRSGESAIRKSQIYFGEIYDATFIGDLNAGVEVVDFEMHKLIEHECEPVSELAPLDAVKSWSDTVGRNLHDFGQNTAGYVRLSASADGVAEILIEHAEVLDENGEFYNGNYRSAEASILLKINERGIFDYSPYFTYQGYRYVRVTCFGSARVDRIQSVPITSVPRTTAGFSSGHPLVNQLFQNSIWSHRSNFIDVPTDCPQRDERLGFSGDAQVFAGTACYLADSHRFLTKYVRELMIDQAPNGAISHTSPHVVRVKPGKRMQYGSTGWGDAITVIPWRLYVQYGDIAILDETLPAMVRWIDFVWSFTDAGIVRPPPMPGMKGFCLGDWLQPKGPSSKPMPTIGDDAAATYYLQISLTIASKAARLLGEAEIAVKLQGMLDIVEYAFAHEFLSSSGRLTYDDQTSYALAVLGDLVPDDLRDGARKYFRNAVLRTGGRLGTGFIGTPALLPALVKVDELALAGEVFLQEDVPGWLYQVRLGATTIWERWDAIQKDGTIYNPQMNSFNHYAFGAVSQWLLESVAGFSPVEEAPGFAKILFSPVVLDGLSPVAAHYDSPKGRVEAGWTWDGEFVRYDVFVPEGAEGILRLSTSYRDARLNGVPVAVGEERPLAPGAHAITFVYPKPSKQIVDGSVLDTNMP
jgi:alpha-L-rhamnosidase